MKELGRAKLFTRDGGGDEDLVIEALAPVEGSAEYRSVAFKASRVDCVFALDDELSAIQLNNGITIPVALKFADLKKRIYGNDFSSGDSIDLTLVTGKRVGEVQEVRLAKKFNPAADVNAPKPTKEPLEILLFAHGKPTDREFKRLRFSEAQIDYYEPHSERKDKETFVKLKAGQTVEGLNAFYVSVPLNHFTFYLNKATKEGTKLLDLGEATRPQDVSSLRL